MGNIALRAGIKPISVAFQASVLTNPPPRLPGANQPTSTPTSLWEVSTDYYIFKGINL